MSDLKERLDVLIRTEQTGSRLLMQLGIDALARIAELEAQLKAAREALEEADDALGLVQQSRASRELSERSRGYIQDARDKIAAIRPKPTSTGETNNED